MKARDENASSWKPPIETGGALQCCAQWQHFSWQSRELVKLDGPVETLLARADADAFAS